MNHRLTETEATHPVRGHTNSSQQEILSRLRVLVSSLLRVEPSEVDVRMPFLEMGADSIVLVEAMQAIEVEFSVKLAIRRFFEDLSTIEALASFLEVESAASPASAHAEPGSKPGIPMPPREPDTTARPVGHGSGAVPAGDACDALSQILDQQLKLMAQQLETLRNVQSRQPAKPKPAAVPAANTLAPAPRHLDHAASPISPGRTELPSPGIRELRARSLSSEQQNHLDALTRRYTDLTAGSKRLTQRFRPVLADSRASAGFRFTTKEMLYPLVAERSNGARLWDIDGNEYLDISMGFGVNLFGHNPDFVTAALQSNLEQGFTLGPQTALAGEVATLVAELTAMERVAFTNSGTEAVMTALRLARTAAGRHRVAMFSGSYHGHFDGTLGTAPRGGGATLPVAPGVAPSMVSDTLVLPYDEPRSLELIREHADELAAVLVEPVQSRHPALQPREFLHELRAITREAGIALVFDEMITGFRIHPGGAQAWFGVRADLATYGKIVGGGMPIGVIAGTPKYMDAIDGGFWGYGNATYPQAETTFFAGTFCKHPVAMASARAVLEEIKRRGPELQAGLNRRTQALAETLNAFFEVAEAPIRVDHFGSLFRFSYSGNQDLLFYHLLEQGIYVWEGRNCFLSTAHGDAEIEVVVAAVQESVRSLRRGGFLPLPSRVAKPADQPQSTVPTPTSEEATTLARACEAVPLSEAQKQLWVLAQMDEAGSLAYHVSVCLELAGTLRPEAMRAALNALAQRHDALRTVIDSHGDVQWVLPEIETDLEVTDLSDLDRADRDRALEQWFSNDGNKPFDLVQGPLWRAHLIDLGGDVRRLILSAHHIIVDGWSMGAMLEELAALYSCACRGTTTPPAPALQFGQYLEWQRTQLESETMERHQAYWLERLAGPLPGLDLPTERTRPAVRSFCSRRRSLYLDQSLVVALKRLAKERGVTPFMLLLAIYSVLLHRLTRQDDLIVGIPASGRSLDHAKELVGYCAHLTAIRSQMNPASTFADYLNGLRGTLLDAYEHQDFPFARLIKRLGVPVDAAQSPLVTATFNLDRPIPLPAFHGLEAKLVSQPIAYAGYDLNFNLIEDGGSLLLQCDYSVDLFDDATVERLVGHFQTLAAGVVADPGQRVSLLPLLSARERQQILVDWNATDAPYPQQSCVHHLIEAQVARIPGATAVSFGERNLSFAELNARANQLAHYLAGLGVGSETPVGLCLERSPELLVAMLGILKAGAAYLPLDPSYPSERLAYMVHDAASPVVLTSAACRSRLPQGAAKLLCVDTQWDLVAAESADNPTTEVTADNLAYVIYTSGSTGKPKGTLIMHRGLVNYLSWCTRAYEVAGGNGSPVHSSIGFDATITSIFPALLTGRPLVLVPEEQEIERLCGVLRTHRDLSLVKITPAHLDGLSHLLSPDEIDGRTRAIVLGGEALNYHHLSQWRTHAAGTRLINEYGPTETVVGCCVYEVSAEDGMTGVVPIGRPIANTQLYLLDDNLQPVPIGVAGELFIGGAGVARGYLNQPELTAEKFITNPFSDDPESRLYRTGDLARYLPDGNIEYLGRLDHQVKVRGFRIELGEIEAVLGAHPSVSEVTVIARDDGAGRDRLVAYVVPDAGVAIDADALRRDLVAKLPGYMVPSAFVALEALPLTVNGKVDRHSLPAPEETFGSPDQVAPSNETESLLARIWCEALGKAAVGVHDNFFHLGGDSILAIQVVARAGAAGVKLAAKDLFVHPTIAALAACASANAALEAEQGAVAGAVPLTPIQHWFFDRGLAEPQRYCQVVRLSVPAELEPEPCERIVERLMAHHDALRLQFAESESGDWVQTNAAAVDGLAVRTLDLATLNAREAEATLERAVAEAQADMDLARGPLLRVVLGRRGPDRASQLVIAIHHLAVDGVSWRILLEDWQRAFAALSRGEAIDLPAKTTSFKEWAARLDAHAQSSECRRELDHWLQASRLEVPALPHDHAFEPEANTVASEQLVEVAFDHDETRVLLEDVAPVYRTRVEEILLTALLQAFAEWTGEPSLRLDLEGHGREALFDDVDVSRTVGWFTSLYPATLTLESNAPGEALKSVKEQLRRVPGRGIGFGLLYYLCRNQETRAALEAVAGAEVSFNYLGRVQPAVEDTGWSMDSATLRSSPCNRRSHLIEIDAQIIEGRLQLDWRYSNRAHRRERVESVAQAFASALRALISHCQSPEAGDYTPSDFPLAGLNGQSLAKVSQLISRR